MPTYQYACTACGEQLEAVQSFTDAALTDCPACQGQLRKVFSAVGVVFKGSGFYKNDSRSSSDSKPKSDKPAETAAKTDTSSTAAKSDSSSSTKTETKSAPAASSSPAA